MSLEKAFRRDADGMVVDIVDAHKCDSKHTLEPRLATVRMFWVTGPVEYCEPCAAWMREVAETLGVHVHEEPIPPPPSLNEPARRIVLGGFIGGEKS